MVHVAAHVLGYCVLAGSLLRSVPQIIRILKSKSVDGLSMTAHFNELLSYSITSAYNLRNKYPFSTWGDVMSCWVQDIVIMGLFILYKPVGLATSLAIGVLCSACLAALLSPTLLPMQVLTAMQGGAVLIVAFGSRVPQIVLNFKRGNTGELSFTTCLLNFTGNVIRVFTTITLTGDMLLLGSVVLQMTLNGTLVAQCLRNGLRRVREGDVASLRSALL